MDFRGELKRVQSEGGRVLVVGLGLSGIEVALFLRRRGVAVTVVERQGEDSYRAKSKYRGRLSEVEESGAQLEFDVDGERVREFADGCQFCVLSPGVSLESAICGTLRRLKIPMVSELELGVEVSGAPALVVTGSNGKSTTVSLIQSMLVAAGKRSLLCGNVGIPVVSLLREEAAERPDFLVVEASSYQLETCSVLRPVAGVFLNLSDNHLERHGSLARYFKTKERLFHHQTDSDTAVINIDDVWGRELAEQVTAKRAVFGRELDLSRVERGALIEYDPRNSQDLVHLKWDSDQLEMPTGGTKLLGLHNRYDIAAALLSVWSVGVREPNTLVEAIKSFEPLEHRLEQVGELEGCLVINDSKATTVAAAVAAVQAVREAHFDRRLILMLGGLAKAGSWTPLMALLKSHEKMCAPVVCFGADARILMDQCRAAGVTHVGASNLEGAWQEATKTARSGDVILLSPGCASFDQFSDFEARGAAFKTLVSEQI